MLFFRQEKQEDRKLCFLKPVNPVLLSLKNPPCRKAKPSRSSLRSPHRLKGGPVAGESLCSDSFKFFFLKKNVALLRKADIVINVLGGTERHQATLVDGASQLFKPKMIFLRLQMGEQFVAVLS